jgi:hypothetical protein
VAGLRGNANHRRGDRNAPGPCQSAAPGGLDSTEGNLSRGSRPGLLTVAPPRLKHEHVLFEGTRLRDNLAA